MSYCDYTKKLASDNLHKIYHDTQYGFRIEDDNELFGRLILEINQAGLSWDIILKKQDNFRKAFANFSVDKIASLNEKDIEELMQNKGIIRNNLKIRAVIHNAKRIQEIQQEYGSFRKWLDSQGVLDLKEWVKLFKKNFKFTGGEIVNEFLMSIGTLPGAHTEECPIYKKLV